MRRARRAALVGLLAAGALACREASKPATDPAPTQQGESPVGEDHGEETPSPPTSPSTSPPTSSPSPVIEDPGPSEPELAYLAAAKRDEIIDEARAEAEACDAGDQRRCRELANRYEEGIGAPHDRARALSLYRRGCSQGEGYHCLLGGWLQTVTRDADELAAGVELLRRACELDYLHGCTLAASLLSQQPDREQDSQKLRAKACLGGYLIACDQAVEPRATDRLPKAEAACPASFHWSTSQSGGPRLHDSLEQLDHEALLATMPTELASYETTGRNSSGAGIAGTRTCSAWANYKGAGLELSLSIIDRAPDCTLQPGTGEAMVALAVERGRGSRVEIGGWPGVSVNDESLGQRSLTLWVADRCVVSVSGTKVDEQQLKAVVERVDLAALGQLCSQRPQAGLLSL